jgi:hypothetical protein
MKHSDGRKDLRSPSIKHSLRVVGYLYIARNTVQYRVALFHNPTSAVPVGDNVAVYMRLGIVFLSLPFVYCKIISLAQAVLINPFPSAVA